MMNLYWEKVMSFEAKEAALVYRTSANSLQMVRFHWQVPSSRLLEAKQAVRASVPSSCNFIARGAFWTGRFRQVGQPNGA